MAQSSTYLFRRDSRFRSRVIGYNSEKELAFLGAVSWASWSERIAAREWYFFWAICCILAENSSYFFRPIIYSFRYYILWAD
jgi:hypothetical protein